MLVELGPFDELHPFLLRRNHPHPDTRPPIVHFGYQIDKEKLAAYAYEHGFNDALRQEISEIPMCVGRELQAYGLGRVREASGACIRRAHGYGKGAIVGVFSVFTNYSEPHEQVIPERVHEVCAALAVSSKPQWFVDRVCNRWGMTNGGTFRG
ncbi:hypothetical protein BV22DRAFT_1038418 [Leucogyrophana mollusca]|uniref:Uncharacterized protein n=1 Tax=Leucogyrophana mollusca TaxID=85980 RepID=A0ACB8B8L5_9AGAM|nr:hypothetical protein BV22DRAFT_1038418 [Leucogyrophana mollusca]